MYHHFHKHRYQLEQAGAWSFVPPSVKRKWRHADKKTDKVEKLRKYMAMRRDRFLRIRYGIRPDRKERCNLPLNDDGNLVPACIFPSCALRKYCTHGARYLRWASSLHSRPPTRTWVPVVPVVSFLSSRSLEARKVCQTNHLLRMVFPDTGRHTQ